MSSNGHGGWQAKPLSTFQLSVLPVGKALASEFQGFEKECDRIHVGDEMTKAREKNVSVREKELQCRSLEFPN
jgi:hypothetical protein